MIINNQPLVSILMAVYNESLYLEACITSLLAQDYKNIEIIIVDDFSTDNTYEIATKLMEKNSKKIKLYKNITKGKASAFSLAFKKSVGNVITLIGGDDTVTKSYITSRMTIYQKLIIKSDKICIFGKLKSFSKNKKYNGIVSPKNIKHCNNFSGGLMLFSRKLGEVAFPVPNELPSEDGWLGLHARFFSTYRCVDSIVLNYRIHSGNTIDRNANFEKVTSRIASRRNAETIFYMKYKKQLNKKQLNALEAEILLEHHRVNGHLFKIFFLKNINLVAKLRAISYSNKYIYYVRIFFFRLFSGI